MSNKDEFWMKLALEQALEAETSEEVPIGSVVVDADGNFVASASNRTISDNDPTSHAEILALRAAAAAIGNYRLTGMTVYSTIEPCIMCAGALVNARLSRLVFGAHDERFGAVETLFRLCDDPRLNHRIDVTAGVLAEECRQMLQAFFRRKRADSK